MEEEFKRTIKVLIKASQEIKKIYQQLALLEIKNKKNTKEYNKLIRKLNIMQDIEDIYYSKIDNKIKTYYDFLYECEHRNTESMDEEISERISNYLITRCEKNINDDDYDFLKKYYQDIKDELQITDKNLTINKMSLIENYINDSILNTYLYLLELKSKKNPNLIKEKYSIITIYKHKEKDYEKNNFDINDLYHIDSKTLARSFRIKQTTYQAYLNSKVKRMFFEELKKLLIEKPNNNEIEKQISEECLLRAMFTFADANTIEKLNYAFHELIDSEEFSYNYDEYEDNIEIITKAFKGIKKDKSKVKLLSIDLKVSNT